MQVLKLKHAPDAVRSCRRLLLILVALSLALTGCASQQTKAKSMAQDLGISLMLPRGQEIGKPGSYGNDVMRLEGEPPGMSILYPQYEVQLRKVDGPLSVDQLDAFVALPQPPPSADSVIVVDETRPLAVRDQPAVAVTWHEVMGGGVKTTDRSAILVFQYDGVVARVSAEFGAMSTDALVALADTFEPVS